MKNSLAGFGGTVIALAFILSNLRATMFVYLYPDTSNLWSPAWIEILLWLFVLVMVIHDIHRNDLREELVSKWR